MLGQFLIAFAAAAAAVAVASTVDAPAANSAPSTHVALADFTLTLIKPIMPSTKPIIHLGKEDCIKFAHYSAVLYCSIPFREVEGEVNQLLNSTSRKGVHLKRYN